MKVIFLSYIIFLSFTSLYAQSVSFQEAWNMVLESSDTLKAKKENFNMAHFRQKAAKALYLPDITLSATYTHLEKPIELQGKNFLHNMDNNSIQTIVQGIAKGASSVAYQEAIQNGKSTQEALAAANKSAHAIISSMEHIGSSLRSYSATLIKQDNFYSSIRAMWPIFTGGKIEAAQIVERGSMDEAIAMLELAKLEQFETLAKVYFGVALLKEVVGTKKEVETAFKKHLDQALKLEKYGQIAKIERLSAQVNYDKAKIETKKAIKDLEIAHVALTKMLHTKKPITPLTKLFTNKNLPSLKIFTKKTLHSYPLFALYRAKKVKTDALIKREKSSFFPTFFLFGNYTLYKEKTLSSDSMPDWLVGVGANYKLLDNKGRGDSLQAAYSAKMQVEHLEHQASRDVSVLVEKTYRQALQAIEEYEGLNSSIALGKENVNLHKKSFAQGLSTSMSVVDAELFLQGVKTQRTVAAYHFVLALTKLLSMSNQIETFSNYP